MTIEEWEDLISTSYYQATVEIQKQFQKGNYEQVETGLKMLTQEQKSWEELQLLFKLKDLMFHVLSGIYVPQKRTRNWYATLWNLRDNFKQDQEHEPILNNDYVREIWGEAFEMTLDLIKLYTEKKITTLTWEEVFEKEFSFRGEKQWEKKRRLSKAS